MAIKELKRQEWISKRGIVEKSPKDGDTGLEKILLTSEDGESRAVIYPFGALVAEYESSSGKIVTCRPDAKFDGSKPISGGISLCWPQFGPGEEDTNNNIQQHGFARNLVWNVVSESNTKVVMELVGGEATKEFWETTDFTASVSISLTDSDLSATLKILNTGSTEAFNHQAAFHSYFSVGDIEKISIQGSFEGAEFVDKMDGGVKKSEERSAIAISEAYDRIYPGVTDPTIVDTTANQKITISNSGGWADTVLWNPFGEESMGFKNFVCVESAMLANKELSAGEEWSATTVLKGEMIL